jgi:hypothetical protein
LPLCLFIKATKVTNQSPLFDLSCTLYDRLSPKIAAAPPLLNTIFGDIPAH